MTDQVDAVAGPLVRGVRRLSDKALALACQNTPERIGRMVYVAFSERKGGWCVFQSYESDLHSNTLAGPFETREQAEALLGFAAPPLLPST